MLRPEEARERYWRQVRDLAEKHEVSIPEARSMWGRFYQKGGIKKLLLLLTPNRNSLTICPYCRDELPVFHDHEHACSSCGTFDHPEFDPDYPCDPEPTWTCPRCSTQMHEECYQELATCTTLGCSGQQRRQRGNPIDVDVTPRVYEESPDLYWPRTIAGALVLIAALYTLGILIAGLWF